MNSPAQNFAVHYVPTLRQRAARRLGFRYHLVDLPEAADALPGWMFTRIRMRFGIADRLRLLLTGRLNLDVRQATSVQVDEATSATSWRIGFPGDAHD